MAPQIQTRPHRDVIIQARMTRAEAAALDEVCRRLSKSRSTVLREAVGAYLTDAP